MAVELFNPNDYRALNPDLSHLENSQAHAHFLNFGLTEERRFSTFVDLNFYRSLYPDLAALNYRQAFDHLQNLGVAEGRQFSQFFDIHYYRLANPDLLNAGFSPVQLLDHFRNFGLNEERRFSAAFDVDYYRQTHPDLVTAGLNSRQLYDHFQNFGLREGRASSAIFDVRHYLTSNPDLVAAGFDYAQAYTHFVTFGFAAEGRFGTPEGYPGEVRDDRRGTAVPPAADSPSNPADYNLGGVWSQIDPDPVTGSWSATADINFVRGQPRQFLPLQILDNSAIEGNQTVVWQIPDQAPFGFAQPNYTFSEAQADNSTGFIEISDAVEIRLGSLIKTVTLTIQDDDFSVSVASTDVAQPIPARTTITSDLLVGGISGVLQDVNLTLDIEHPSTGMLQAFLLSPSRSRIQLFSRVGGSGDNFSQTTFDDQASQPISAGVAPFSDRFRPNNSLAAVIGEDPNGVWELQIVSSAIATTGTLNGWSLEFQIEG